MSDTTPRSVDTARVEAALEDLSSFCTKQLALLEGLSPRPVPAYFLDQAADALHASVGRMKTFVDNEHLELSMLAFEMRVHLAQVGLADVVSWLRGR